MPRARYPFDAALIGPILRNRIRIALAEALAGNAHRERYVLNGTTSEDILAQVSALRALPPALRPVSDGPSPSKGRTLTTAPMIAQLI
jgi:hypothetical protein